MTSDIHSQIRSAFSEAEHILIVSHVRPDGDAIGAIIGLGLALSNVGKEVQMVLADGIPSNFRYLTGSALVKKIPQGNFDLKIVVDCSDLRRTGGILNGFDPDINIDHHISNLNFGRLNLVEAESSATSAIIANHLESWGLTMTREIANALLTGIVSDTLGFRTTNVNQETLLLTVKLMGHGADLSDLYYRSLLQRSYESALYWGAGLDRLQKQGRLVWTSLTLEDRQRVSYPGNDDADLVNLLSTIDDSDIAVIFVEQKDGRVKVSWRSQPGWDVSQIALSFGGGGHAQAAGADIPGTLEEIKNQVLQATQEMIENASKP